MEETVYHFVENFKCSYFLYRRVLCCDTQREFKFSQKKSDTRFDKFSFLYSGLNYYEYFQKNSTHSILYGFILFRASLFNVSIYEICSGIRASSPNI